MTATSRGRQKTFWKPRRIVGGLVGALVLLAVLTAPANAYPRPGITERVSVASDGTEATGFYGYSYATSISADGRYVAFESLAENLVPGDTNDPRIADVYVHDRETGTTERVSVASDGTEGNGFSDDTAIASNGRYIAFVSSASNLVPGDTNGRADAFVHDRETHTTERVSVASDGTEGNSNSYATSISADGRYVAFNSLASNLVPGDTNGTDDVFVYDRLAHTTERVSVASDGAQGNGYSRRPSISADGRYVAFGSLASNLVPGDANGAWDVYVHDRETRTTDRVSVGSDGAEGNLNSLFPSLSADGRYVGFESEAWNLVPWDTNEATDVFVHDRETHTTERVSVGSDGSEGNSGSYRASISADGRQVALMSFASNLVPGNTTLHVYVYDRETRAIDRASVASDGAGGDFFSAEPSISADGRYVGFESVASNLVPGDTNGKGDVFVRDRGPAIGVGEVSAVPQGDRISVSGWATFSGQVVALASDPSEDGATGAGPAGGELTGASLTYRPEEEDLLVRLRLASLPRLAAEACALPLACVGVTAGAGVPGILYGLELDLAGGRYEVRAAPRGATAESLTSAAPHFALYWCDPGCTEQTRLTGGIGTTGPEVMVSVPLAALGASEGTTVEGIRAFTAIGEAGSGTQEALDEADLPDAAIPAAQVSLGIGPAGTEGAFDAQVAFSVEADLLAGDFSGTIPTAGLSPGSYRVWARACLGDACGPASFEEVAL